jgi:tetratricopeptide (TPR) repeat protein
LQFDPTLAAAAMNRGILHLNEKRYPAAIADLQRALEIRGDAAAIHYNLALVHLANGDRPKAIASLQRALQRGGEQPEARDLLNRLLRKP